MKKTFLLTLLFFLMAFQLMYSVELLNVTDRIQKSINTQRFSVFYNEHNSDWYNMKEFKSGEEYRLSEYIKMQIKSFRQGKSNTDSEFHRKFLNTVVTNESELNKLLNDLEMIDQEKAFLLTLLKDIRTYGINNRTPFILERMADITRYIDEIKFIKVDKELLSGKLDHTQDVLPNNVSKRKVYEATASFNSTFTNSFYTWYAGVTEQYKNNDIVKALAKFQESRSGYYGLFGVVSPNDVIRYYVSSDDPENPAPVIKDVLVTNQYGFQIYPWVCEDVNICNYYLNSWDDMITSDALTLSIFHQFLRKYAFREPDIQPPNEFILQGEKYPDFELEYVPGYFTYVAYREKRDYSTGMSTLDSFINQYPGNWKTGYWYGYKAFFQLFMGDDPGAISSVNSGLPILQNQSERYKKEIDLIKECRAAASRNSEAISFYQLLKKDYPSSGYLQYWNLAEGYCYISTGNYSQAIPLLKNVISSSTQESWEKAAHLYLGFAYYKLGDYTNAENSLGNAITLPENPIVDAVGHYLLGNVFEKQGKVKDAFNKFSFVMQKYGSSTDSDLKYIAASAKKQAEALLGFEVVNVLDQKPAKGIIGVGQTLSYKIKRNSDFLGEFTWEISSRKISVTPAGDHNIMAYLKGESNSTAYQDTILTVTFKTEDQLEYKTEIKMTCIAVKISQADKYYPYNSSESAKFKYQMLPDLPQTDITFIVEKNDIPGYEMNYSNTGEIVWKGVYNNSPAVTGKFKFIIQAKKEHGIAAVSDFLTVFDVGIKGKEVIYLGSSPIYEAQPEPVFEGSYKWTGSDIVTIISPDQRITEIRGESLGTFDLGLTFTPDGSRLSAKKTLNISVNDPISVSLVSPAMNPIFMNQNQQIEFTAKTVHVQGAPVTGIFKWSCNLGKFSKTVFSNTDHCSTLFTAETIGESVMKISFTSDGRERLFERPIYVDKHIAIPSFTFFPADDVQLDIGEKQEFSIECRYNSDVVDKIGEWYDISDTLKFRIKGLKYEDDKGLLKEISGYDQSLLIRGFKAVKHGKSVLAATVDYEIEKKVKNKWLRISFSKKHDHVFRVVPPIDFKVTADQQIFRKAGEVNETRIYAKPDFAGKRIEIGKSYHYKGYDFKILSLKWDPKIGTVVNNVSGDPIYQIPIDQERLTQVGVSGKVEIIDRNRNIDIVEVVSKTPLDFAVLDPQITVTLDPNINSEPNNETIAGVYEFFKIKNIKVVIPVLEFKKDIEYGGSLKLVTLFNIPLNLDFSWALYQDDPVFEANNAFEYGKNIGDNWTKAYLAMKFKVDKMEFTQVQREWDTVHKIEEIVKVTITPDKVYTVIDHPVSFNALINDSSETQFDLLNGKYHIEIHKYEWKVNNIAQNETSSNLYFLPTQEHSGKYNDIDVTVLGILYKKDISIPSNAKFNAVEVSIGALQGGMFIYYKIDSIEICETETSSNPPKYDTVLTWDKVIFRGWNLQFRAKYTPNETFPENLTSLFKFNISTSVKEPNEKDLTWEGNVIKKVDNIYYVCCDVRGDALFSLLPSNPEDGVDEFCSAGNNDNNDSDYFDNVFAIDKLGLEKKNHRGGARIESVIPDTPSNEELGIPIPSPDFHLSGGVENISVQNEKLNIKDTALIQNQADYLYISSHGYSASFDELEGSFITGTGGNIFPNSSDFPLIKRTNSDFFYYVNDNWKNDVKVIIFALCSVLDIGDSSYYVYDHEHRSDVKKSHSPGKYWWKNRGSAKMLIGYCATAPGSLSGVMDEVMLKEWDGKTVSSWLTVHNSHQNYYAVALTDSGYTTKKGYQPKQNVYWCFMNTSHGNRINRKQVMIGVPEIVVLNGQTIKQWEKNKIEWKLIDFEGKEIINEYK